MATDAMVDYGKLVANTDKLSDKSTVGNITIDYHFMDARLAIRTVEGYTAKEWIEKYGEKSYVKRIIEHNVAKGLTAERAQYKAFQMYSRSGCMNAFRPLIAKRFYQKYRPTKIVDPCAGWGGRCLAAMALNIDYIGYDTNTALAPLYADLQQTYPTKAIIQFHTADCTTLDASGYDMVFTSPPYCKNGKLVEAYPDMPHYANQWEFNVKFMFPMIHSAWNGLAENGTFALNIPSYMYEDIVPILGEATDTMPLPIRGARSGYTELIYIWRKTERILPKVGWALAEVRESATHGLGAFAKKAISVGTRIAHYIGEEYTISNFTQKYGKDMRYCYSLGRANTILCGKHEPYYSINLSHFMNESLNPNVILRNRGAFAARDIASGEELFLKYPKSYPRDYELRSA
jgi:hypothetical protein